MVLVLFLLALLAGSFLHPLGEVAHRCDSAQGHVDVDPDEHHDAEDCAHCHLAQSLAQGLVVGGPSALVGDLGGAPVLRAVSERRVAVASGFSFSSRAPPRG